MRLNLGAAAALAAFAGTLAFSSIALADDTVIVPGARAPVVVQPAPTTVVTRPLDTQSEYVGPNRSLIASGLVTFGISYGAAAIVAGTSNHPSDEHLYVPVVGPWLNLADRGPCGPMTMSSCDNEATNKVLLVFDGVFQGIGVLSIVGGLLTTETRTVATVETAKVRITPTTYGRGAPGLALIGQF